MIKFQAIPILLLLIPFLAIAPMANAGPIIFEFVGEITDVIDPDNHLGGEVVPGTLFSGEFTFETTTLDDVPEDSTYGNYYGVTSFTGQIGNRPFFGDQRDIPYVLSIGNDVPVTNFDFFTVGVPLWFMDIPANAGFGLNDLTGTAFQSDTFPVPFPPFGSFNSGAFGFGYQPFNVVVEGRLNSFNVVPEPGTLLLLGTGIALLRSRSRHRIRVAHRHFFHTYVLFIIAIVNWIPTSYAQNSCGCVDLVFVIDTTSSMTLPLIHITDEIPGIVQVLSTNSGGDLRLGLLTFTNTVKTHESLTADVNKVLQTISSLTISSDGGGEPEASDEALKEMLSDTICGETGNFNIPFDAHCNKYAILITDARPAGCNDAYSSVDMTNAFVRATEAASQNIRIISVFVRTLASDTFATTITPIMQNYASQTNGFYHLTAERDADGWGGPVESYFGTCPDCNENGRNDVCDTDCAATGCTSPCGTSVDCNGNHVPDECERDCNGNGQADKCDINSGISRDCHKIGSSCCYAHPWAGCDLGTTQSPVCAAIPSCCTGTWTLACVNKAEELVGCPLDLGADLVPDECQASRDCNNNNIADDCDVNCGPAGGACNVSGCGQHDDCNGNCIPDVCDNLPDCNLNGIPDSCDIAHLTSNDCQGNGIPDECEIAIAGDCNLNDRPDECDIEDGFSCDSDSNGIPDECIACCTEIPNEGPVCENRLPSNCAVPSVSYAGLTCDECTCQTRTCCAGSTCCELVDCACLRLGGIPPLDFACGANTCVTGSCCTTNGCEDVIYPQNQLATKALCDSNGGTFKGGVRCKGGTCQAGNPKHSCSSNADCPVGTGPCIGTPAQLAQPSPCASICPVGEINRSDSTPPDMTGMIADARYPHPPNTPSDKLGIGDPNGTADDRIQITLLSGATPVAGADLVECWCLCETAQDTSFGPNSITCVEELGNGLYGIQLARPITTFAATTISYKRSVTHRSYISHPANVNGNPEARPSDILALIDNLNGVLNPPLTKWQCDINHSTVCAPDDILGEIDMLNGNNGFAVANGTMKPTVLNCPSSGGCGASQNACAVGGIGGGAGGGGGGGGGGYCVDASCGVDPGPMAMAGPMGEGGDTDGGDSMIASVEEENQPFADWFVNYLSLADPTTQQERNDFSLFVDSLTQWALDHFTVDERAALAERLNDPKLSFTSEAGSQAAAATAAVLEP